MLFNSIQWCHLTLILLNALLLFTSSFDLSSANDELSSTDGFATVSSFSYPQTTLRPFDFRYIRGD